MKSSFLFSIKQNELISRPIKNQRFECIFITDLMGYCTDFLPQRQEMNLKSI
jgi:hypothetical protein